MTDKDEIQETIEHLGKLGLIERVEPTSTMEAVENLDKIADRVQGKRCF